MAVEESVDLSVFALEGYAEDDPLPEGVVQQKQSNGVGGVLG